MSIFRQLTKSIIDGIFLSPTQISVSNAVASQADITTINNVFTRSKEPTGIINPSEITITASTRTITVASSSNKLNGYYRGVYFEHTCPDSTLEVVATPNLGTYIYVNAANVLSKITTTELVSESADYLYHLPLVCYVYWDNVECHITPLLHGISMDGSTWGRFQEVDGLTWEYGADLTADDATLSFSAGAFWNDDIRLANTAVTQVRYYYRDGSNWVRTALSNLIYYLDTNLKYDNAGTLSSAGANEYVAYWVCRTADQDAPFIVICGQRVDTTLANARKNNVFSSLTLGTVPFTELKLLYRVIAKNDASPYEEKLDLRGMTTVNPCNYIYQNQIDAITGSNGATSANVFATIADLPAPELTADQLAAISGANTPSAANVFATMADCGSSALTDDEIDAIQDSNSPSATNVFLTEADFGMEDYTAVTQSTSTTFTTSGADNRTKYTGDNRDVVGHPFVHYWSTSSSPASVIDVLATFSGAGSGYLTLADTDGVITVTGSTTNPNFETAGVTTDDKLCGVGNTGSVIQYNLPISGVSSNTITVNSSVTDIEDLGAAFAIQPLVSLSNSSTDTITVSDGQDLYFKGIAFIDNPTLLTINVYGEVTFENCTFFTTAIRVHKGGKVTFVGYCNSFINCLNPIVVLRGGEVVGAFTVLVTSYSDPSEFKNSAIRAHTGAKVDCPDIRCLWVAFGAVAECGSQVHLDRFTCIKSYRDGIVSRGGHVYGNTIAIKRGTSGYCVWNENGVIFAPSALLVNEGGTAQYNSYIAATDNE